MRFSIFPAPILSLCLFAGVGLSGFSTCARAQNEVATEVTKNETPATVETAPGENAPDENAPDKGRLKSLPAQNPPDRAALLAARNAARRAGIELRLRAMMSDFGVDEAAQQDALIAYLAEDEAGKNMVRDAARRLMNAIKRGATPARTRDLIAVYKASLDADKERRAAAQNALDAKIGFSQSPRLEATLWLFGVLGEGQAGLPLSLLTPRTPRNPPDKILETGAQRAGTVVGNVAKKGQSWIEVRAEGAGVAERYLPFWTAPTDAQIDILTDAPAKDNPEKDEQEATHRNYDGAVLEAMKTAKVGDRVRLEWVWNERKRVVRLELLPATQIAAPAPIYPPANP